MKGLDSAQPVDVKHIALLKRAGYGFVAGYYSYNPRKNLTRQECAALSAAGIAIVSVFEAQGNLYTSFHQTSGAADAARALRLAEECGQPQGSAIYFAVDFDATASELRDGIGDYFRAVNLALAGRYRVGAYGSGLVLATLRQWKMAELFWLADAGGWQGTHGYRGPAQLRQGLPTRIAGLMVDPDIAAAGDFGQWMVGRAVDKAANRSGAAAAPAGEQKGSAATQVADPPVQPHSAPPHAVAPGADDGPSAAELNREELARLSGAGNEGEA